MYKYIFISESYQYVPKYPVQADKCRANGLWCALTPPHLRPWAFVTLSFNPADVAISSSCAPRNAAIGHPAASGVFHVEVCSSVHRLKGTNSRS